MAIAVKFYAEFDGFAIAPNDIKWGNAGSSKVSVLQKNAIIEAEFKRLELAITIRGILEAQAEPYINEAEEAALKLVKGTAIMRKITIGGRTIKDAVLISAEPSPTIKVGGDRIIEELVLTYQSQRYI